MVCASKGISMKEFATELIIREIEEFEDMMLAKEAQKRLDEMDESENISIDDAFRID